MLADKCFVQPWPEWDAAAAIADEATVVVQVQGKKKATLNVPASLLSDKDAVEQLAMNDEVI